jgi:hypothetical protein
MDDRKISTNGSNHSLDLPRLWASALRRLGVNITHNL